MALTNMLIPPWVKPVVIGVFLIGLAAGGYFKGRSDVQIKWDLAKAETEKEIAELKAKEAEITIKTITKYVDRIKVVKEKGEEVIKYVDKYITVKEDLKYPLPNNFVELHDAAAKNVVPDATRAADENPSRVKISTATRTIAGNYNTCNEVREQLISLQDWIRQQQVLNK